MEALSIIGFLVFFGSLIYLVYHFIRKIKNKERILSKKKFYPVLIGGFLFFVVGSTLDDTYLKAELEEALEIETFLTEENETAQSQNEELEKMHIKLNEDIEKMTKEIEGLESKLPELEKNEDEINQLKSVHKEEVTALEEELSKLKTTNSSLKDEVENFK